MSRDKDPECRGLLTAETDNAIQVSKTTKGTREAWWFPRSQIGYCRKTPNPDGTTEIVFTLPEWLIEKKQAWALVP